MKRHNNLFERITSFENLLLASRKAQKGKRFKSSVGSFNLEIEKELLQIQYELRNQVYRPGSYKRFFIYDPKKRLISAAPYRDRVVHHALCNIIEPIFDKTFIRDSYACRVGKGTHKAVDRFTKFCRQNRYVLKCDISKYFDSVDHHILFELIARKIKDKNALCLIKLIIDSLNGREGKGIPIGNLTSQFFANIYLNGLDHFIKERLKCGYYIRYVDDFVLLADNKNELHEAKKLISDYLAGLKLNLHPKKSTVSLVSQGTDFLGYKIYPTHRLVKKSNVRRFVRRMKKYRKALFEGKTSLEKISMSIQSWIAHASHADSRHLLTRLGVSQDTRRFLEQYSRQPAGC
jgi:retron-type reverse transcriptase